MMHHSFICITCGTQYRPTEKPPPSCPVCEDERQYVNPQGQAWTTLPEIRKMHTNKIEKIADNLYAIYTTPGFAIDQRAHLLVTPSGNILWDCIANLDDYTIDFINKLGGIQKIAISHPHYYATMWEWSHAFRAPVFLHEKDQQWIPRNDFDLQLWNGSTIKIVPGATLINCGGHFEGGAILHYNDLLLTGDVIQVASNLKTVSFMYSFPNHIPLPKKDILQINDSLKSFSFEAIYGAFGRYIHNNGRAAFEYSIDRYLKIYE